MTLFRVKHNKDYTTINNTICRDSRLSWKAKGIWLYAFSRPDDWQFNLADLVNQSKDQKSSVNEGLKELEKCGYLTRTRLKNEKGRFDKSDYTFNETPQILKEKVPQPDFPSAENPRAENQPLLSTEVPNTEVLKGIDLDDAQTLPLISSKVEGQKFPLKKEQQEIFNDLKSLDFDCDDKTLIILIRSYSQKIIKESITHLKYEIAKGTVFKISKIAFFRHLLKGEICKVTERSIVCKKFAEAVKHGIQWHSLKITDKYVKCEKCEKEISLDKDIQMFRLELEALKNLSEKY